MLKAEVNENTLFSAARPHAERHGDAGNNLKPIFEVVGPANSWAHQEIARLLCGLRRSHLQTAIEKGF